MHTLLDLKAPTLAGPPQTKLGAGIPSYTTPQQPIMDVARSLYEAVLNSSLHWC